MLNREYMYRKARSESNHRLHVKSGADLDSLRPCSRDKERRFSSREPKTALSYFTRINLSLQMDLEFPRLQSNTMADQ